MLGGQSRSREGGVAYPFVESPNVTPATARRFDVVVMHTMEIAERKDAAEICARWFASPVSKVSAHYCVDADTVIQCVREKDIAWHARGGNTNSIGVELAGFARQTREELGRCVLDRRPGSGGFPGGGCLPPARGPGAVARRGGPRRRQARHHGPRGSEQGVPQERPLGSRARVPGRAVPRDGAGCGTVACGVGGERPTRRA